MDLSSVRARRRTRTEEERLIDQIDRGRAGKLDEVYDLGRDPYELTNLNARRVLAPVRARLRRLLRPA